MESAGGIIPQGPGAVEGAPMLSDPPLCRMPLELTVKALAPAVLAIVRTVVDPPKVIVVARVTGFKVLTFIRAVSAYELLCPG